MGANEQDPTLNQPPNGDGEGEGEGKVTLDGKTYNALLDRLEELEALATQAPRRKEDPIDDLYEEGLRRSAAGETRETKELDEMSNTELFQYIMAIGSKQIHDIAVGLETVKLLRQIDKVSSKYDDFDVYEEEIKELAMENPTLSIEKAYKLAKAENPTKGQKKQLAGGPTTRTERILQLPSRHVVGEKPSNMSGGSTKVTNKVYTTKDAAEEAWDEVVGKKE